MMYSEPLPLAFQRLGDDIRSSIRTHRSIAIGIGLSLLLHGLLLVSIRPLTQTASAPASTVRGPLEVRINPAAPRPPVQVAEPQPNLPPKPEVAHRRSPPLAVPKSKPQHFPIPVEPPAPPTPAPTAKSTPPVDFISMLNAKRRANEDAAARENAEAQTNSHDLSASEIAAANIERNLRTMSRKRDGTSGVFEIVSKGTRSGTFVFRGWTVDSRDTWREVHEVDAGLHGNVELAIVRRMIELIRTHYQGNFNWESQRLGRVVVLSARLEDNGELEAFLMREFFGG